MAYYSTSHAFDIASTSTIALEIWRALSDELEEHQAPVSTEELCERFHITPEQVEFHFRTPYYYRFYGFRRFETVEEFTAWATSTGVLYNPELHDMASAEPDEEEAGEEDPS